MMPKRAPLITSGASQVYEEYAKKLRQPLPEPPPVSAEMLWLKPSVIRETEGLFLAKMQMAQYGVRFVFSKNQFWMNVDKYASDCHFETFSRKEVDVELESEVVRVIHHSFRLLSTADGSPRGAMRDIYHFHQTSYENPIRVYITQRAYKIRSKQVVNKFGQSSFRITEANPNTNTPHSASSINIDVEISPSSSTSSPANFAPIHKELAPFVTFSIAIRFSEPFNASNEWKYFYQSQYAIDLWTLDQATRLEICSYLAGVCRRAALEMLSGSSEMKLSRLVSPDGLIASPPLSPPKISSSLDEEDEATLHSMFNMWCSRPYVRLVFPYLTWYVRRERHYEFPHWTGGSYSGWCKNGLPHLHGKLKFLRPQTIIVIDGEFNLGVLHGAVTCEILNTVTFELLRFQGLYQNNRRIFGIQEWLVKNLSPGANENDFVVVKRFQGSWDGDEPAVGVWETMN